MTLLSVGLESLSVLTGTCSYFYDFVDASIQSILAMLVELRSKRRSLFTKLKELLHFKDEISKWSDLVSGIVCKDIRETSLQRKMKKGIEHIGEKNKKNR